MTTDKAIDELLKGIGEDKDIASLLQAIASILAISHRELRLIRNELVGDVSWDNGEE